MNFSYSNLTPIMMYLSIFSALKKIRQAFVSFSILIFAKSYLNSVFKLDDRENLQEVNELNESETLNMKMNINK